MSRSAATLLSSVKRVLSDEELVRQGDRDLVERFATHRDQAAFAALVALVRDGGRAASVVGGAGEATEIGGVAVSNVGGNPEHLSGMAELVVKGALRVAIRRTYPLAELPEAIHHLQAGHARGKIAITSARPGFLRCGRSGPG